ncbi:alpha/beta hydrolase [Asanoa ferruginea]|uniref:alpha/beta hydrolase n=1 Tax=Asanoa ferruginea TaxID=53367 RepID=UPI000E28483E|nr:alpha/beta hydrolase [Asanoa ferruginea]
MEIDVLGQPYERRVIDLGHDDEGPLIATLVSRRAERPTGRAVLYVHGFVDYFFQTHLADFYVERGWDFHAIDLRRYGRSLLPHQTPNFTTDLTEYFTELDIAAELIGAETLLVNGHSTGGLVASLWAHARRDRKMIDGLFLNSPFFDFNMPWLMRRPVLAGVARLGRRNPRRAVPRGLESLYGQSLHINYRGEWDYNLAWKPIEAFPIFAGWVGAIRTAHRQLWAGLDIPAPVLVACSTRTFRGAKWNESINVADAVLDVEHIVRYAPRLGQHVTLVRIDGGIHDLTLSGPQPRERLFTEVGRWIDAYVTPTDGGPAVGAAQADSPDRDSSPAPDADVAAATGATPDQVPG